jgi:peptide/nickel transport system substrate-binding protein
MVGGDERSGRRRRSTSRREFLERTTASGAALGVVALAGCSGDEARQEATESTSRDSPGGDSTAAGTDTATEGRTAEIGERLPTYTYMNNPPNYNPARNDAINLVGERLNELGFDVDVQVFEWGTLYSRVVDEHDFDMVTWHESLGLDPGKELVEKFHSDNVGSGGSNWVGYENATLDDLLDAQMSTTDTGERVDHLHEIQRILIDDAPYNPIVQMPYLIAYNNEQVSGWEHHLKGYNYYYNMVNLEVSNDKNELRGAWPEAIGSLNPLGSGNQSKTIYHVDVLYDYLVRMNADLEYDPELSLATGIRRPDERTVEYTLRDHTWHDGEALTAEDVAFTIDYTKRTQVPRFLNQMRRVETAEALDENTVRVVFNEGEAPGPVHTLFSMHFPIVPKHVWEDVDDPANREVEEPIGSGPLQFEYWDRGSELSLARNPDHFVGVSFDRRIWRIIPQESTTWTLLKRGDLNYLPLSRIGKQLNDNVELDRISVVRGPGTGTWHFSLNLRRDGLDGKPVRKSMVNAIPKTTITRQILFDLVERGFNPVSVAYGQYHNPDVMAYEESVETGRERLREAGYSWDDDGLLRFPTD